ncbi:MAG: hypothetical protein WC120_02745 [Parcubacteria group bacterium]
MHNYNHYRKGAAMLITTATDAEIIEFVRILIVSLGGVKNDLPASTITKFNDLYVSERFSECIREVKNIYRLNLTLRICFVKSYPGADSLRKLISDSARKMGYDPHQFGSELQKDLSCAGAFILQPARLPIYGTPPFENLKLLMFVFRRVVDVSMESFIYSIAHEMSHIILNAMRHPLEYNEVAADLTAMILGFSETMKTGRKTDQFSLGYLNNHQFEIAYQEIIKYKNVICL